MFELFFSFKGRIGRQQYWIAATVGWIVQTIFWALVPNDDAEPALLKLVLCFAVLATAWSTVATGVKRLHDLGKSGWWFLFPLLPLVVIVGGLFMALASGGQSGGMLSIGFGALLLSAPISLYSIWLSIQMYFFPGEPGPNQYGAPPTSGGFTEADFESKPSGSLMSSMDAAIAAKAAAESRKNTIEVHRPNTVQSRKPVVSGSSRPAFGRRV